MASTVVDHKAPDPYTNVPIINTEGGIYGATDNLNDDQHTSVGRWIEMHQAKGWTIQYGALGFHGDNNYYQFILIPPDGLSRRLIYIPIKKPPKSAVVPE